MAMEVTQILLNAQSLDAQVRKLAEENLKQFEEQNFPVFLASLALEVANPEKPDESRRLAALVLKNAVGGKEQATKQTFAQRWLGIDPAVRAQIKSALLSTLTSVSQSARRGASQAISKIASIELPVGQWPELVASLLANMGTPGQPAPAHVKQSTLEALGYVCEEIAGTDALAQEQVNSILTAVVQGMNQNESDNEVRLAATQALFNALDFAHTNFENDMERNYIMTVVCEATLCPDHRVRQSAFECLVAISSTYYEKLAPYMQDIFVITSKAVREDEESVAQQAIELWSSICDEEIDIQEEYSGDSEVNNYHFIKQALPALVPMLLETLTKQEEGQDGEDDVWNLSMAGGRCLGLVARTVGDDIVELVMPFVQENITKSEWRCREAATYAFGSILEGPSLEKLTPLVNMALIFMLNAMKDENTHVKDTTAWTLGRIFEFLHGPSVETPVITANNLPHILNVLLESIKDAPNVAEKVCIALLNLAAGYDQAEGSSPLSPFFQNIVSALLSTSDRDDAPDMRLRITAYETLNEVIRSSTDDTTQTVLRLVPVIMQKLSQTLDMQVMSSDDREKQSSLQGLLCGVLTVIIQKLEKKSVSIAQYADQMMQLFLRVFACRRATVHEEAMLAIGALAQVTGVEFGKYMQEFYRYLEMGLQNFEEYQVCSVTVGTVGDIARALEDKILPYCDGIMTQLLKDLSSNQLHRSVKPAIFVCFGDIALAIGEHFEKYLLYAMPMLQSAAELSAQQIQRDDEMVEYNNRLRVGILEAYTGIFQGLKPNKQEIMHQYCDHILFFIANVYHDKDRDDAVTSAALELMGDVGEALKAAAPAFFAKHPFHREFLEEGLTHDDPKIKDTSNWSRDQILNIKRD